MVYVTKGLGLEFMLFLENDPDDETKVINACSEFMEAFNKILMTESDPDELLNRAIELWDEPILLNDDEILRVVEFKYEKVTELLNRFIIHGRMDTLNT